jgi:predicted NBD/HSP70 family sugar kinase
MGCCYISMPPLALTDAQLDILHRLAEPLAPPDRSALLEAVAAKLAQQPELIGDGFIARIAAEGPARHRRRQVSVGTDLSPTWGKVHLAPNEGQIPSAPLLLALF